MYTYEDFSLSCLKSYKETAKSLKHTHFNSIGNVIGFEGS